MEENSTRVESATRRSAAARRSLPGSKKISFWSHMYIYAHGLLTSKFVSIVLVTERNPVGHLASSARAIESSFRFPRARVNAPVSQ